jgi:hypothetical protein
MSATVLPRTTQPPGSVAPGIALSVSLAVGAWFVLIFLLGARDAFSALPGELPLRILFAVTVPIAAFLLLYRLSGAFRDLVLGFDLRLATGIQAWRFAGLGFVALYTHGVLPGVFAWPAGLGDIAIGVTAPLVILALIRRWTCAADHSSSGSVGHSRSRSGREHQHARRCISRQLAGANKTAVRLTLSSGFLIPLFVIRI